MTTPVGGKAIIEYARKYRSYGFPQDPALPPDQRALFPPLVMGGPMVVVAALREGMCPFGHTMVPVPAGQVDGFAAGRREGECHGCRPCTRWRWDHTAHNTSWCRARLHIMGIPQGHT